MINHQPGYSGHFILITDYDDSKNNIIAHDPDGGKDKPIDYDLFEKAWSYPNENAKNIIDLFQNPLFSVKLLLGGNKCNKTKYRPNTTNWQV
jgi:hypothetical protein